MARPAMVRDKLYLQAIGQVALAASHLELVLRYMVRALEDRGMVDALNATERVATSRVRNRLKSAAIRRGFAQPELKRLTDALDESERLAGERNKLLHRAVQADANGRVVQKTENQTWGPAPTVQELLSLAENLERHACNLNEARLTGWLRAACAAHPLPAPTSSPTTSSA